MPPRPSWLLFVMFAVASLAHGDAPVKTQRTLLTPEQAEARRHDINFRNLALSGDSMPFTAAVGNAPAGRWVDKPDEWFWHTFPGTQIMRTVTVGDDPFRRPKLGCPVHGQEIYTVNAYYPWIVDCDKLPFKLKCPIGGETYPSNDFGAGDMTTGPYADDGKGCLVNGTPYYFIGLYNHYAYNTMLQPAIKSFGHAYLVTGDQRYAHKAAVCLLKEAFEYPNGADRKDRTYIPGYEHGSGMITDVVWSAGALNASAMCYDEIVNALDGDAELLAFAQQHIPEIKTINDLKLYLEDRLFRVGIQALLDGRVLPNTGWAEESMATMALVMDDFGDKHPNSIDCLEWLYYGGGRLKTMGNQFYKDGSSYESTGYNSARGGFVRAADLIERTRALAPDKVSLQRYPDIRQNEKLVNFFGLYTPAIVSLGGPFTICVGDIGAPGISKAPLWGKNERSSEFLDGYGLGILRSGTAQDQRDLTMFYGGVRGHAHYDPLMLGLHGYGRDLLPNIGYPQSWSYAGAWEWSLLTHNTVAVDRDEQPCSTVIGSLTMWATFPSPSTPLPGGDGGTTPSSATLPSPTGRGVGGEGRVQVIEASKRPYRKHEPRGETGPDVTDYRRLSALIDLDAEHWYAIDVFRITGGNDHLQSWHGGYTPTPVTVTGAEMVKQEKGTLAGADVPYGEKYKDATGKERWDPYCYLKDVARGKMGDLTSVDFDYATEDRLHLRLSFVPTGETELVTAHGGAPISPDKDVLQWALPHRSLPGSAGVQPAALQSQFVTILEAYTGTQPLLTSIRRLPCNSPRSDRYEPIALEILVPGGRDIILLNGDRTDSMACGSFALSGRFGLIRERGGKVVSMYLAGGSRLQAGKLQITQPAPAAPTEIVAVDRAKRQVTVHGVTPALAGLKGRRIRIDNHGERLSSYTIVAAQRKGTDTILTLDSSGSIGEGIATDFEDGVMKNGPEVNMPFAGLVKIGDRFDYSDCFYNGGHLETGKPGVDLKVHGVMGFAYQAWGDLHKAGTNHVQLYDNIPAAKLRELVGQGSEWTIYEYGVGDTVSFDDSASLQVK